MPVGRRVVKSVRRALWHSSTGKRPRKPGKHGLAHRNADLFTRPHARSGERRVCPRFPADIVVFCKRLVLSASGMGLGAESIASGPVQAFLGLTSRWSNRAKKTFHCPCQAVTGDASSGLEHRDGRYRTTTAMPACTECRGRRRFFRPSWSGATRGRKKTCPHTARGLVRVR